MMRTVVLAFLVLTSATLFGACDSGVTGPSGQCQLAHTHCDISSDCCSLQCKAGVCFGDGCYAAGANCASDPECCNNSCVEGFCAECLGAGETCQGNPQCCSGNCGAGSKCM